MLRIVFGAAALLLFAPAAFACDGQTGKVIFEDEFTDDAGGWAFGEGTHLVIKAPGATLTLEPSPSANGITRAAINLTFDATQGDFCTEGPCPADAAQINAGIGVVFWATDSNNYWLAAAYANSEVAFS